MSPRRLTSAFLALAVLLATPVPAATQGATPATEQPASPGQPAVGPGGTEYVFPGVQVTSLGDVPGGGFVFEPTTEARGGTPVASGPLPLVLLIDGCCYQTAESAVNGGVVDGGQGYRAWIDHLVRRGAIVVYPIYRQDTGLADVAATMRAALAALNGGGHVQPDPARTAVVGFSAGGPEAVNYAAATAAGLPVPGVLLVYGPRLDDTAADREPPPPAMRALVLVGDRDPASWMRGANTIWEWLAPLPAEQRDYVSLVSDDHGQPSLAADHYLPLTTARLDGPTGILDALDWFGAWKLTDALMACAFAGEWCEHALGNTPEQRFMGTWSDGVAVQEPVVTDDPETA